MSTSLLYHAFGIRGYTYLLTEYHHGQVFFTIGQDPDTLRCSGCGSRDVGSRGHVERRFKSLPIGGKPVSIVFPVPRIACSACGAQAQLRMTRAAQLSVPSIAWALNRSGPPWPAGA